jgi:hypothetical protein
MISITVCCSIIFNPAGQCNFEWKGVLSGFNKDGTPVKNNCHNFFLGIPQSNTLPDVAKLDATRLALDSSV